MTIGSANPSGTDTQFLAGYRPSEVAHDELYQRDGSVRSHWAYLMRSLTALGAEEFDRRWSEGRRLLRDHGATYNVYDEQRWIERPWPLDPLPVLIPSAEWQIIEQGLIQRAELLELVLADVYGSRRIIREGVLPPELIYGHPGFLRPCAGVRQAGDRHLPLYAADLARAPGGQLLVLGDRTQAPSGAGYAFENRTVMTRMLPSIFRDSHVHQLPLFYRQLRALLAGASPRPDEPALIVLLTPGPKNETYFEHAYLADLLGCTLAEGQELSVRDQRVWLRTVDGMRQVDVILRRVDGDFCDPLELRADSLLGVPGLLQSARAGNVAIVNPLGSSVVENPGLMPFLPGLAQFFLGEELKLPSVRTWWCGDPQARRYVVEHLAEMVVKPIVAHPSRATIFGGLLAAEDRDRVLAMIENHPHLFVGQAHVALSTTPVFVDGSLEPRAMVLRTFLTGAAQSYTVMAGGLCRVAPGSESEIVSNQVGGVSKDIWVLASEPEREADQLLVADKPLLVLRGELEVPGHVADDLFWVGRYAERSESTARLLRQLWRLRFGPDGDFGDRQLLAVTAIARGVTGALGTAPGEDRQAIVSEAELMAALYEARRNGSLRFNLVALLRAARGIRDRFPSDSWRVMSALDMRSTNATDRHRVPEELDRILSLLAALAGLTADSMPRTQGWRFLEIGRRLERALVNVALLRTVVATDRAGTGTPWDALLVIADASMRLRKKHRATLDSDEILSLLIDDETYPRSLAYQLLRLEQLVAGLSRIVAPPQQTDEQKMMAEALSDLKGEGTGRVSPRRQLDADLDERLQRLQQRLLSLSDHLTRAYFKPPEQLQQLAGFSR